MPKLDKYNMKDGKRLRYIQEVVNSIGRNQLYILEIECGIAHASRTLIDKGHHVVGIDSNNENISAAQAFHSNSSIDFYTASVRSFKSTRKFDVIICNEILSHADNSSTAIFHIKRLLRQDGVLIITKSTITGLLETFFRSSGSLFTRKSNLINQITIYLGQIKNTILGVIKNTNSKAQPLQSISFHRLSQMLNKRGFVLNKIQSTKFRDTNSSLSLLPKNWRITQKIESILSQYFTVPFFNIYNSSWNLNNHRL